MEYPQPLYTCDDDTDGGSTFVGTLVGHLESPTVAIINGWRCELRSSHPDAANALPPQHGKSHYCGGCPLVSVDCSDRQGEYLCSGQARAARLTEPSFHYWHNPVLYELNQE